MSQTTTHPHVILICADQWRGDCLSLLDHPDVSTPYLDRLGHQGAVMTRAYSANPTCVPARMSLMTGLSAGSHRRVGYRDGIPFDHTQTLPAALGRAGYQTHAIGKMHYWPQRARIGFDEVELHDGYLHHARHRDRDVAFYDDYLTWLRDQEGVSADEDLADHGLECNSMVARPWDKAERLHPTTWVVTRAIRWLYRRDPTAPFFLYLSFHRPHAPYDPPQWAWQRYADHELHVPPVGDWAEFWQPWRDDHDPDAFVARYPRRDVARAQAGYYGHMSHIDAQVNRLREALGEFGLLDSTVMAFTSDHGDMMGDHHLWRKGYPYEGSSHVPFLLNGPTVPAHSRVDEIVELRDVMPTLLDCAGVDVPAGVEGRSVLPLVHRLDPPWREHLHGEHTMIGGSLQWIVWQRHKYVWISQTGTEQLFDLTADPTELHDLSDDPCMADVVAEGRRRLVAELDGRQEGFVQDGHLVAGRPVTALLDAPHPPSPEGR